jgi:hypothetical protein
MVMKSIVTIVGLYLLKFFSYTHKIRVRHHENCVKSMSLFVTMIPAMEN